jgi:Holliday junction DNA helicase RuvB
MIEQDRVIAAGSQRDDEAYDRAVRPKTLADYVGQPAAQVADHGCTPAAPTASRSSRE